MFFLLLLAVMLQHLEQSRGAASLAVTAIPLLFRTALQRIQQLNATEITEPMATELSKPMTTAKLVKFQ